MAVYYQVHFITGKPKHKYYSLFFRSRQKKKKEKQNWGQKKYVGV